MLCTLSVAAAVVATTVSCFAEDLVIYGGTPAGLSAGIVAACEGASVVVIEPTKWIGGETTTSRMLLPPLSLEGVKVR